MLLAITTTGAELAVLAALADEFHDFVHFAGLFGWIAAAYGLGNTGVQVVLHDEFLYPADGGKDRAGLGEDIHAIAVFVDHFANASNLSFNTAEPVERFALLCFVHHSVAAIVAKCRVQVNCFMDILYRGML